MFQNLWDGNNSNYNLQVSNSYEDNFMRERGVMVLDVGCEFRDQSSIPSEWYQVLHDADLGQFKFTTALVASLLD